MSAGEVEWPIHEEQLMEPGNTKQHHRSWFSYLLMVQKSAPDPSNGEPPLCTKKKQTKQIPPVALRSVAICVRFFVVFLGLQVMSRYVNLIGLLNPDPPLKV